MITPLGRALCLALCVALVVMRAQAYAAPTRQEARSLRYGEIVRGRLSDTQTEHTWQFTARAGDAILIDMKATPGSGLDPYLSLLGPDGATLVSNDDSGEGLDARIGPFDIPASGRYHITASRYGGTGDYTLQVVDLHTLPTIQHGKPLAGEISASHPADYFTLSVPAAGTGALWQVSLHAGDGYTPLVLTLLGAGPLPLSTEDSGGSTLGPLVLLPGARYVVVVAAAPDRAGGAYEIRLDEAAVALLQDGEPQTGELPPDGEPLRFFFRGTHDERVSIAVTSGEGTPITVAVALTGAEEALFQNGGAGAYAVAASLTVPQDGLYEVNIWPARLDDGGPCTVTLARLAR
jgi:hypothetical protein